MAFSLSNAYADPVTFFLTNNGNGSSAFDFDNTTDNFDDPSGLSAVFTAIVAGSTGTINATANSFGVNASGGSDDTDQLDGDEGLESIQIVFSGDVSAVLTGIDISSFGADDTGTLDIGGTSTAIVSGTDTPIPVHSELVGNTLTIAFTSLNGNGFSVDSLSFDVVPAAVPEPSSLAIIGLGSLMMAIRRRR